MRNRRRRQPIKATPFFRSHFRPSPVRVIDESIDGEDFVINKPDRFKTGSCRGKVRTLDRDIDVARIADGVLVNPGDPLGYGVATA